MFLEVLRFLKKELNDYLKLRYGLPEDIVVISNLLNQDGSLGAEKNKIVMSLINIEEDRLKRPASKYSRNMGGGFTKSSPPMDIVLHVLIVSNFEGEHYEESLKFIRGVVGYFQSNALFWAKENAELSPETEKLVIEMASMDLEKIGRLWGVLGNKYMPSVIYKIKTFVINEDGVKGQASAIFGIE